MLSNRRMLHGLGSAFVAAVVLASLGLWSAVASASPQQSFAVSCAAYVYDMTQETSASWSGLHVKDIDLTWYDSNGGFVSGMQTVPVKGGMFTWPTPYGAATVTVTFYSGGPGRYGSPVDVETASCSAGGGSF